MFGRQSGGFHDKVSNLLLRYKFRTLPTAHWTTMFEISFSGDSDTNHGSLLWNTIPILDHYKKL